MVKRREAHFLHLRINTGIPKVMPQSQRHCRQHQTALSAAVVLHLFISCIACNIHFFPSRYSLPVFCFSVFLIHTVLSLLSSVLHFPLYINITLQVYLKSTVFSSLLFLSSFLTPPGRSDNDVRKKEEPLCLLIRSLSLVKP